MNEQYSKVLTTELELQFRKKKKKKRTSKSVAFIANLHSWTEVVDAWDGIDRCDSW